MIDWQVLWCLINNPRPHIILKQLREEHFSTKLSRDVYFLCKELLEQGYKLEKTLITSHFKEADQYLEPVNKDNYQAYIEKIDSELFARVIQGFVYDLDKKKVSKSEFLSLINSLIQNYVRNNTKENILESKEIVESIYDKIFKPSTGIEGIKLYIDTLDELIYGLKSGNLILIAGRPSMGKSALLCWIALQNALDNVPTLFFSLEMNPDSLMYRMMASETRIHLWKIKKRSFTSSDRQNINDIKDKFKKMPLIIDDTSALTIEDIEATIAEISSKHTLGLILVDYAQIMSTKINYGDNRNAQLTEISGALRNIAKKYNVPIILASQLSRQCEQRDNKRPQLSDLRDSGSLEQDADIVLMLYRDYYYNWKPQNKNLLEILVRKFREGEIGKIIVEYNLDKQFFSPIKHDHELYAIARNFQDQ